MKNWCILGLDRLLHGNGHGYGGAHHGVVAHTASAVSDVFIVQKSSKDSAYFYKLIIRIIRKIFIEFYEFLMLLSNR